MKTIEKSSKMAKNGMKITDYRKKLLKKRGRAGAKEMRQSRREGNAAKQARRKCNKIELAPARKIK